VEPAQTENQPTTSPPSERVLTWPQIVVRRLLQGLLVAALLAALGLGGFVAVRNAWAWYHYHQAEKAIANYKLEEGLAHLELCLSVWKRSAETNFLAARTARRNADYEKAEKYLQKSDELGWVKGQLALEAALLLAQRDDPVKVEGFLQERIRREDPDSNFILEALAQAYMASRRWPGALSCVERWIQLEPDNRRALYYRGLMRAHLHRQDEAISDFNRVLELDPDHDDARLQRAELLLNYKADFQKAAEEFEYLRERQPAKAPVALGLARAYRALRRREEARNLLDQILIAFPRDPQALSERGRLARDSGQYADAEDYLRRSLDGDRSDADAIYDLIAVLRERKKSAEAKEWEKRLVQLKADKERFEDLNREMAERPRDPGPRLEAAQIMLRNGQDREAMGWFQLALQLDPAHAPTHRALADFWESKGDAARAAYHKQMAEGR
jgi:tetratricopeptide (TPR) repeat protein